jgi:putative membrane protein
MIDGVKFMEVDLDAKFANIHENLKNRYDLQRLVRRATATLFAFLFIVSWFMDFVWTLHSVVLLVFLFTAVLLLVCVIKIYQSGNREKNIASFL